MYQSFVSKVFKISQGTRQGSIISPWLYSVYINDLLNELCSSEYSLAISDVNVTCPTQADDICLLSLTKHNLDMLIDICYKYSCNWRFRYNASKSVIIVFNESCNARL